MRAARAGPGAFADPPAAGATKGAPRDRSGRGEDAGRTAMDSLPTRSPGMAAGDGRPPSPCGSPRTSAPVDGGGHESRGGRWIMSLFGNACRAGDQRSMAPAARRPSRGSGGARTGAVRPWPARRAARCESASASDGTTPGVASFTPDRDLRQDRGPVEPSLVPGGPRDIFGEFFRSLLLRLIRRLSGGRSQGSRAVAPARHLAPAGLAAALAAFLLVLLAGPETHAQTSQVLVSNLGQSLNDGDEFLGDDFVQSFTTGTNAHGYTLIGIDLRLSSSSGTTPPTVTLHSGCPRGAQVTTFTGLASIAATRANYAFTSVGTVALSQSTTFWVVAEGGATGGRWWNTASNNEDTTPVASRSIANFREVWVSTSVGRCTTNTASANYLRVRGSINPGPTPSL